MKTRDGTPSAAQRKAAVGWADLLWVRHTLGEEDGAGAAALLGFERRPEEEREAPLQQSETSRPQLDERPAAPAVRRPPLRATHFAVVSHESFPDETAIDPEIETSGLVLDSVEAEAATTPRLQHLSPQRRLAVFLRRQLRARRSMAAVDVGRLIHHLVRASLPERLPRQQRLRWTSDAALLIDFSLACVPLRSDLVELAETAHALSGGRLPVLWFDEVQGWLQRQPGRRAEWKPVGAKALRTARHWLLAGSLGVAGADTARFAGWARRIERHIGRGGEVTFLTGALAPDARQALPVRTLATGWDRGRRFKLARVGRLPYGVGNDDTARLLAALSMAVVVEPALLRAVRLALGLSTAAELAVWNHPDVEPCLIGMQIRRDRLVEYRAHLRAWPLDLRQQMARLVESHHAAHSRLIRLEEAALAADLAGWNVEAVQGQWAEVLGTLRQAPDSEAGRELTGYLQRAGLRAHPELWRTVPAMEHAYVLARRSDLMAGADVPAGVSVKTINRYLDEADRLKEEARPVWFVQTGPYLAVRTRPPIDGQFMLLESPPITGFELEEPDGVRRWRRLPLNTRVLGNLLPGEGPWTIRTPFAESVIAEVPRPSWVIEWGRDEKGLYAYAPSPFGRPVRLDWFVPPALLFDLHLAIGRGFSAESVPIALGVTLWADLQFGLVLDVHFGNTLQRFRWIEPGEFWMGSPEGEAERNANEGPRHVVRLTEGFWLAETACSQSVWLSVMRRNPSKFTDDPQNPVEQVSWDDVQGFLREVEKRLPGVKADLPTEAEWEYACRAGSETAFSWGDGIAPDQANYNATISYAGGPTGEHREKTVPVKSYAPNAWGLYQMHGNVWEWCADGRRDYDSAPQVDPRGPEGDAPRAVRGGSWFYDPHWLRAASRGGWPRGRRYGYLGFRFSLRSTSQQRGAERPPEAAVAPEDLLAPLDADELSGFFDGKQMAGDGSGGIQSAESSGASNANRYRFLEHMLKILNKPETGSGSVPWSALRETIPVVKKPKPKRGGKK